jgi:site-specific recombinase XerD
MARSVTTAVYQDSAKKKDGTQSIYLRVTIERKIKTFPTGISIPAKFWDKDRQQVKLTVSGLANARELSAILNDKKAVLDKAIFELQGKKEAVTFASIERKLQSGSRSKLVDYCAWRNECEANQLSEGTVRLNGYKIALLKNFDADVELSAVTTSWLEQFQGFLFTNGTMKNNTIRNVMKYLVKIFNYAYKHGDIDTNPFKHFNKLKYQAVDRQYLTRVELARLLKMYTDGDLLTANLPSGCKGGSSNGLHHCLQQFLASCFTGLRFSDIAKLKPLDFHGEYLSIVMKKTKEPLRIPINAPLRSVLNLHEGAKSVFLGAVTSNPRINDKLEQIMALAGIKKHITFHCARHTFAIMALELGMPIEVVSHILGHGNLSVTQIYARVVDAQKTREMAKMDAFMATIETPTTPEPKAVFLRPA